MVIRSTPCMGVNTMDVTAMLKTNQTIQLSLVVGVSLALLNQRKDKKEQSVKTKAVTFKDGTTARGVKLSDKNIHKVATWLGHSIGRWTDNTEIRLYQNGSRQLRVAKLGDLIVKTEAGFTVIKAENFEKYLEV